MSKVVVAGKTWVAGCVADYFLASDRLVGVLPSTGSDNLGLWWKAKNNPPPLLLSLDAVPEGTIVWSVYYDKIFTRRFLSFRQAYNIHNSPLPKYRGVRPINWAMKNMEPTHGVTIHRIDGGIDTGPIHGQITFPIWPDLGQEVREVYGKCLTFAWELFKMVEPTVQIINPSPQDDKQATYYSLEDAERLEEWGTLDGSIYASRRP